LIGHNSTIVQVSNLSTSVLMEFGWAMVVAMAHSESIII
jgi:hypothetical protein